MARSRTGAVVAGATYTVRDNPLPYVAPAIAVVVNLGLAGILSATWGAYAHEASAWDTAWRAVLLAVVVAAMVAATWAAGRARQAVLRVTSVAVSGMSGVWLFVLTFKGFSLDRVIAYVLTMGAGAFCLLVIRLLRGDGQDPGAGGRSSWFSENIVERVSALADIGTLSGPKVLDGVVATEVEMVEGASFADLQKPEVRTGLASVVGTDLDRVRAVATRGNVRKGRLEFTARDAIANPPAWPGLVAPGQSIADAPLRTMVYRSGAPVPLWLTGDQGTHRNAPGLIVVLGQPGSGKTEFLLRMAEDIMSRSDTELTVLDPRKADQLPAWLRRHVRVIRDMRKAARIIARLVDEVPERAAALGAARMKQWQKGAPIPFKVIFIDEASKIIADKSEAELVELAESIRSVGVTIVLFIQRGTVDRIPSSVKKARGAAICFGTNDDTEAGRVLSAETIEAGASPGSVKNERPGCAWVEWPGVERERWSEMVRTYKPDDEEVVEAEVAELNLPPIEQPPPGAEVEPAGEEGEIVDDDDDKLDETDNDPGAPADVDPPDMDSTEAGDVREPRKPGKARISLVDAQRGDRVWKKPELMAALREAFRQHLAAGRDRIQPADLHLVVEAVGPENLKPPKMSGYLREFCQPGPDRWLRKSDGWYLIEPPESELASASSDAS